MIVAQISLGFYGLAVQLGEAGKEDYHLLPGDGGMRGKPLVCHALGNAVFVSPNQGVGVELTGLHVGEGDAAFHSGRVCQTVQNLSLIHIFSVTSSVMQFQYGGFCINILDTPGHQDFSEDTYRTLMAADSAVMVIDGSKGVEAQTRKLFKVCAMRHIPLFNFVNKMDREAKDPFDLLEELERELGIETYAMNWPIGSGKEFQGVYDRQGSQLLFFSSGSAGKNRAGKQEIDLYDPQVSALLGEGKHRQLIDEVELLGAGRDFDLEEVRAGKLSPVFFGSALTNFGVEPFLEEFLRLTPPPASRVSDSGLVDAFSPDFSAFVFKIQANMNKACLLYTSRCV